MTKRRICPVCNTDECVIYIMGTHAEGKPIVVEDREQYIPGDCIVHEHCECNNCGGEFSISYEIQNGKTKYLKIDYKERETTNKSSFHTWA